MSDSSVTSERSDHRTRKRVRGVQVNSVIAAAAKIGRPLAGAIIKPGGIIELKFAEAGVPATDANEWDEPR